MKSAEKWIEAKVGTIVLNDLVKNVATTKAVNNAKKELAAAKTKRANAEFKMLITDVIDVNTTNKAADKKDADKTPAKPAVKPAQETGKPAVKQKETLPTTSDSQNGLTAALTGAKIGLNKKKKA